jgi:hypothetical protein
MIISFFLGNCMGTRATLIAPARGRNVPFGHDHYVNHFTSLRKLPRKARPSSAHSRQQTLLLDSVSKRKLQMQNTLSPFTAKTKPNSTRALQAIPRTPVGVNQWDPI